MMYSGLLWIFVIVAHLRVSHGDVYMHNPRGSNNRLREYSANRKNANRMFDSQNNNRGGYNVGDRTDKPAGLDQTLQYQMKYFQSGSVGLSRLAVEWTSQHGCGGNNDNDEHKQNCQVVLQYMCQPEGEQIDVIRDGVDGGTNRYTNPKSLDEVELDYQKRKEASDLSNRGLQESFQWYDHCYKREANMGLFMADNQRGNTALKYSSAIHTRQNPNGNRRAYECPEERDYYPYWHPTPWKDIGVLTDDVSKCKHYKKESFNVRPRYTCVEFFSAPFTESSMKFGSKYNNEIECRENNGQWLEYHNYLEKLPKFVSESECNKASTAKVPLIWARPLFRFNKECLVALKQPDCSQADWSRVNHHGNGRDGTPSNYTWTIPHFPSKTDQRCAVRVRYNISTDDYDIWRTDASMNTDTETGVRSPVQQNPYVDVGADNVPLRLAINTAQFGRTFQDRSHAFTLRSRESIGPEAKVDSYNIYNLNVRGKRGNIVQTYPAVEYDFIPNDLRIKSSDLVHIQWTGSNSHRNEQPEGDGQAGDAGEGRSGTDRSNLVQIPSLLDNYPVPYESSSLFSKAEVVWKPFTTPLDGGRDLAMYMASSGYFRCKDTATCSGDSYDDKTRMNPLLDNAPASFEGALLRLARGEYSYMCSRNNNFSNRSQKGKLTVK